MLRLEGLKKRYKTGDEALKGVDLEIPDGQVIALIGPSGAGKSTLIRCVNRLVEPTGGKAFLGDIELTNLSSSKLRKARSRMGMIFQEYALVERLTVMENVLSGPSWLCRLLVEFFPPLPCQGCSGSLSSARPGWPDAHGRQAG